MVFPLEDRKMNSTKRKSLIIVFALFLSVGLITVGCKQKPKSTWVNTGSMPGKTFNQDAKRASSAVVYLGSDKDTPDVNFGPRDISFDFKVLK